MIFVNFKTYERGSGQKALRLIKTIEKVTESSLVQIVPVVQVIDAEMVTMATRLPVWMQHVDPISYGSHTGWTLPEEAKRVGVKGVFLNHSEHKFEEFDDLHKAVARCKEVDLKTLVFAEDIDELKKVTELKPSYVSYEPPELVGSTETSVAESEPETIAEAADVAKESNIPLIVGAGVKNSNDVKESLDRGADGVAVARAVVTADDQREVLMDLVKGFRQ
ncbi:triose-phosphate isomerase [Patescibacteria group bacterium]